MSRLIAGLLVLLALGIGQAHAQTCNSAIPASTPTSRFTTSADGTATDSATGLMWKRCAEGQAWNPATGACDGTAGSFTWQLALQRAQQVNAGTAGANLGYSDWRVPNQKELGSIVERRCYSPAINETVFPGTSNWFWSASSYADDSGYAWGVSFYNGNDGAGNKDYSNPVRLVRGGQSFDIGPPVTSIAPVPVKVTNAAGLRVREGPGTGYSIFTEISYGQQFVAYARSVQGSDLWYKIHLPCGNDRACAGWVAGAYQGVTYSVEEPAATQVEVTGTGSLGLNIRAYPNGSVIDSAWDGQRFVTLGSQPSGSGCYSNWYRIYLPLISGATTGWVCGDYLRLDTGGDPLDGTWQGSIVIPSLGGSVVPMTFVLYQAGQSVSGNYDAAGGASYGPLAGTFANGILTFTLTEQNPGCAGATYTGTATVDGGLLTINPLNGQYTCAGGAINLSGTTGTLTKQVAAFTLSGTVSTSSGAGLSGVSLSLTGAANQNTSSDAQGGYTFTGLLNGSYTLTPSLSGYTFAPVSRSVTVGGTGVTGLNFQACQTGVPLTGTLRDATTNAPLSGVSVIVDGTPRATTDSNGNYSIAGLGCGTHTVSVQTPSGYQSYGSRTFDSYNGWTFNIQLTKASTTQGLQTLAGYAADPVNTATGNYTYQHRDLALPGKGMPFAFERAYNSQAASAPTATDGPLGFGWSHSYNTSLSVDVGGTVTIRWGDGKTETYAPNGSGGYKPQYGVFDTLTADGGGAYTLHKKNLTAYHFSSDGKLASIVDKNGNTVALTYTGGNLTRITDTAGRHIDFTYDTGNHITTITDPIGRTVLYAYDGSGNLVSATDRNGNVTHYTYDGSHQILTVTDPRGNVVVSNTYDATNRVVTYQTDAKGGATSYNYGDLDHVTTVTDALGHITTYYHDDLLRLIKEVDARGSAAQYAYDAAGNRVQVTDKNGNVTKYEYDTKGNVTKKTDALGDVTTITYDANNNPLTRTDALGNTTNFTYDANGNLIKTTDALGNAVSIAYDASGLPLTVTDARGNVTTNTYDAQGNLVQVAAPLGNTTTYTYDGAGRRLTKTDALGHTTAYSYDNNDNLRTVTDALGGVMRYTYDGNNNRLAETDRRGYTTNYTYDRKDLLTVAKDPFGKAVTNTYDALDRKIAVVDKKGNLTKFAYDETGNLTYLTDALGKVTQYIYDANGNRLSATDPNGNTTLNTYDALNRRTQARDALGNTATTAYDDVGRVASTTNAKGQITSFTYDAIGRLIKVTDANGGIVQYGYDQNGNRISMTDPNGNVTTYAYDALNRLITKTEPLGNVTHYQYDTVGNLTQLTKPNGTVIHYAYDALNRLTTVTYPDASTVTFSYDANGNRTQMVDGLGTTTEQYDALNRMTRHTDPFGNIVRYNYDANGNRTVLIYPDGKTVTYSYDRLNRLRNVTDWLTRRTSYSYDAAGRLTQVTNPNGTKAVYGYDSADRLTSLTNTSSSAVISSYAYTLDAIGNHSQETRDEPLTPALTPGTVAYTYDAENRLSTVNGVANGFDPNGNMTAKGINTFAYDFEDRLKTSTINSAASQYQYDGVGNRLARTAAGATTRYVLDTNSTLSKVLAETNAANAVSAYYVYGLGLIARIQPDGTARYYHYDSRGSTIALTDGTGAITDKYAYDSFGKLANSQGTTPNPFKYDGRYGVMDEGNGLQYIRVRYYDPEAGRFISKDAKAGKDNDGQSLNRYIYALNSPIRLIDISGFSAQEGATQKGSGASDYAPLHNYLIGSAGSGGLSAQSFAIAGSTPATARSTSAKESYLVPIPRNSLVKFKYCAGLLCEERVFGRDSSGRGYFTSKAVVGWGFGVEVGGGTDASVEPGTTHSIGIVDAEVQLPGGTVGMSISADRNFDKQNGETNISAKAGLGFVNAEVSKDTFEVGVGVGGGVGVYSNSQTFVIDDEAVFFDLWMDVGLGRL